MVRVCARCGAWLLNARLTVNEIPDRLLLYRGSLFPLEKITIYMNVCIDFLYNCVYYQFSLET